MTTVYAPPAADAPAIAHAEHYASLGIPCGPLYPLDALGACTCRDRANCQKPGKHPHHVVRRPDPDDPKGARVLKGSEAYTTDPARLREWFRHVPTAGIGIDAARAGVLDIAPDSPAWLADFEQRGLPLTALFQSPGGEGHRHYLYRLPAGGPSYRITRSGEYDLMSSGNIALPAGRATPGRRWLTHLTVPVSELPEAPAWAVAMLQEGSSNKSRPRGGTTGGGIPDTTPAGDHELEPPVRLDPWAMATWRGQAPKRTPDGKVDRSVSLLKIGRVLYDAGATRRTIVAALRERDETFDWRKFCDRRDGGAAEYHRIIDELEREGHWPGITIDDAATVTVDAPAASEDSADRAGVEDAISTLRGVIRHQQGVITTLRAQNGELRGRLGGIFEVLKAPPEQLRATEKVVAITALTIVFSAESREPDTEAEAATFERPSRRIYLPDLGARAGVSADLAGRTIEKLSNRSGRPERPGAVFVKNTPFERFNRQTGEVYDKPHKVLELRPLPHITQMSEALHAVAAFKAATPNPKHGGARKRCPDHPDAPLRVILACSVCNMVVGGDPARLPQDEGVRDTPPPGGGTSPPASCRDGAGAGVGARAAASPPSPAGSYLHDVGIVGAGVLEHQGRREVPPEPKHWAGNAGAAGAAAGGG